jgi:hypothetical protein
MSSYDFSALKFSHQIAYSYDLDLRQLYQNSSVAKIILLTKILNDL